MCAARCPARQTFVDALIDDRLEARLEWHSRAVEREILEQRAVPVVLEGGVASEDEETEVEEDVEDVVEQAIVR